ncbi:MAG: BMP family ABC transporter substrate-binding protein [Deltaproteobacteria bacterium]|nr:BMP family ABC transporter substrate-binding protein [Deltaproteobacteria bacterium]
MYTEVKGAEPVKQKPFKIGFVYISPVGEAGWSYSHYVAREALAKQPDILTYYKEAVPAEDSEEVMLKMAEKGYDMIVSTSFSYQDATLNVAKKFPNTVFIHCSGNQTAPNVSNYFGRMYQARYLTGMVSGLMSKTNQIGYVAAYPIPEVIRGINAFTLGVREVNPQAQVRVLWVNQWFGRDRERKAALKLIEAGADVLTSHQDSPWVQGAVALEQGVHFVGYHSDVSKFFEEAHLVSAIWNWTPYYQSVVAKVRAGTWKSSSDWLDMKSGAVDISSYGPKVPQEVRAKVDARKNEIIEGKYVVFQGPVKDQNGKERIAKGAFPTDHDLAVQDWFVEGVIVAPKE